MSVCVWAISDNFGQVVIPNNDNYEEKSTSFLSIYFVECLQFNAKTIYIGIYFIL